MKALAIGVYKADLSLGEMPDPAASPGEIMILVG